MEADLIERVNDTRAKMLMHQTLCIDDERQDRLIVPVMDVRMTALSAHQIIEVGERRASQDRTENSVILCSAQVTLEAAAHLF